MKYQKSLNQILEIIFVLLMVIITFMAEVSIAKYNLVEAMLDGDLEAVRAFIGNEETDVNMPISSYGITILMETAYREHTEAVKFLIRRADIGIDLQDEMGITALMRAVFKDNKEIVRILVDAGADVHIPDRNNFSALDYAAVRGNTEIMEILLSKTKGKGYCLDALLSKKIH